MIVQFTYAGRADGVVDGEPFDIGPWMLDDRAGCTEDMCDRIRGYYLYYSDEIGILNTLKNMLLLQLAYARTNTPYLFCWVEHQHILDPLVSTHSLIEPVLRQVDRSRVCPFSLADSCYDLGADGIHPGPQTHEAFAERLFGFYESIR